MSRRNLNPAQVRLDRELHYEEKVVCEVPVVDWPFADV